MVNKYTNATFEHLRNELNELGTKIVSSLTQATQEHRGKIARTMDPRAIYTFWFNEHCIVVKQGSDTRMLDYYGGFEYIETAEDRMEIGQYTIYSGTHHRVKAILDVLFDYEIEEDNDEDQASGD